MRGRAQHWVMIGSRLFRTALFTVFLGLALPGTAHAADTTPPSVPTGLNAIAVSGTQINLTWTASTDDVGVIAYLVERCTGASCSNFAQISTPSNSPLNDPGRAGNTTYRYRVRARDAAANMSAYSAIVAATTPADTQAPTVPANLTATVIASGQIDLSWSAATDNIGVTGYRIERCTGASCSNFVQVGTSTTLSYSNTSVIGSTTYRYRIRANDAAGNLSGYSSIVSATTPADTQAPTAPSGLTATASSVTQINLNWSAATDNVGITAYLIERCAGVSCTNFAQITSINTLTYLNTGLTPNTPYSYRLRAKDAAGNLSPYSTTASASTPADTQAPTIPATLTATAVSATQITLSWSASTDNVKVIAYLVERCTGASCTNFTQIGTPSNSPLNDTGRTANTTYRYRVRARDASANNSGYSPIAAATTPSPSDITPPSAPTNLTATATSSTQVNLTWTASTDNVGVTGYRIERCQGSACSNFTQIATSTATTYNDTGLTPTTHYSYRVRATDAQNNLSAYSTTATTATQSAGPITYTYSYDTLGRLTQANGSDGSVITYTYDANGNVTSLNRQ